MRRLTFNNHTKKKKEKSKLYTIKQNDYKSVTEVRIIVV